jgi:ribosomal protein S18 acetylase RimI-like enzyme
VNTDLTIRPYQPGDEEGWLRCRVLAFLHTAYHEDVRQEKERYRTAAIELVACIDDLVIGLIDVECEAGPRTVCTADPSARGGMIWHVAVHPDYRRRGVALALLREARARARLLGLAYLEAWTRDDADVQKWYENSGFVAGQSYWHAFIEGADGISSNIHGLRPISTFAHYTGPNIEAIRKRSARLHRCVQYVSPTE